MPYQAPIQRTQPTAFLFLVDQSGSMGDRMAASEKTKGQFVADALNKILYTMIMHCEKADGLRNYFDIGVITYSGSEARNALGGELEAKILNPVSIFSENPLRIEKRKKKVDDGAGGIIEQSVNFPVWFESTAGGGTPMCAAIRKAAEELASWCDQHPDSYPPTVLHVTDGESTDGNPEQLAEMLRQLSTNDGNVLLFNLHVSSVAGNPISFVATDNGLPDQYAKTLFRMSSQFPEHLVRVATQYGYSVSSESRGYIFNAEASDIISFFNIGTVAAQMR